MVTRSAQHLQVSHACSQQKAKAIYIKQANPPNLNRLLIRLNRVTILPLIIRKPQEGSIFSKYISVVVHFHHPLKSGGRMLGGQLAPSAEASGLVLVAVTFHYRYLITCSGFPWAAYLFK